MTRVVTQFYNCGRYVFVASLAKVGPANEKPEWEAHVDGVPLSGRHPTLEEAMRAALQYAAVTPMNDQQRPSE